MLGSKISSRYSLYLGILIIVIISIIAWHGILNQTIEGEGYYYFSPTNSLILPNGNLAKLLFGYDNFPRITYYTLEHLFKGNMQPYMDFWLATIILVNIAFFIFVKKITNSNLIALLAASYSSVYYTGNFQFYARGHFQWFTQRVPEVFPIFISFSLLIIFLRTQRLYQYILSIIAFSLALFMSDYTTLFLPFYISLSISFALLKSKSRTQFFRSLILFLPFLFINYINDSQSALGLSIIRPHQTLWQSIIENSQAAYKISYQLVVVTIPFPLLKLLSVVSKTNYFKLISLLSIPTLLFYLSIFIILWKKKFKDLYLVLTFFLSLVGVLFLNVYLNRVNVFNEIEQGRYYYIPGLYIGIIFSFIISFILKHLKLFKKIVLKKIVVLLLIFIWTSLNSQLIFKKIQDSQYVYTGGKKLMAKLSATKFKIPDGSIVMLPNPLMPLGEDFLKKYYSNGKTKFLFIDTKWRAKIPQDFDINKLYVYDYNEEYKKGGKANLNLIEVLDKSPIYRQQLTNN